MFQIYEKKVKFFRANASKIDELQFIIIERAIENNFAGFNMKVNEIVGSDKEQHLV